ncbi:hypothetical protein [Vibrio sp. RE88]|uniref:hypothetical protein n=1 Tax=Vibrio sp. RE88 TaxID=2607610 RepID=UPI0014939A32|nr:hypothetical protein [Vibrio sp. RE88]NOH61919.1 hypothetical protein [Vibrio sp. RE88]
MKKAIVMINPLASIRFILHKLSEYGFASIVISTRDPVSKYCDYYQLDIDELVLSSRNLEEDLNTIRSLMCNYDIVHGWAGSEMIDFQYSELLIHTLFPTTTNDPESSFLRDNKFNMNEKLKEIGLRHIEQELIVKDLPVEDKVSITKRFFDIHQGAVVVKPNTGSSASESVFSPASFVELESYIVNMSSSVDMLIQRKIQGVEYVVDTISWKGEHQLSFSGCYQKTKRMVLLNTSQHIVCLYAERRFNKLTPM